MKTFDRYILKNLTLSTVFVSIILASIIFLTQSLRFLELVIQSSASASAFWILTLLALPRFFEVILPVALMGSVLFIYNRMQGDTELIAMRAAGYSPIQLCRPAITVILATSLLLLFTTMWAGPKSLSNMQEMRQVIKAQLSTSFLREGVFNSFGNDITVFIKEQNRNGDLRGIMIHDTRIEGAPPSSIFAESGRLESAGDDYQVIVFNGSRQQFNPETQTLQRLDFERYTIDFPSSNPVRQRWKEPDERTIFELLNPDMTLDRDRENLRDFHVEIHKRILSPFLAVVLPFLALSFLLLGETSRRGQIKRILATIAIAVFIQSFHLMALNIARNSDWGLVIMYANIIIPLCVCIFCLSLAQSPLQIWKKQNISKKKVSPP